MSIALPYTIQLQILGNLNQIDKVQLSQTCKTWFELCTESLYTNVYITERKFPIVEAHNHYGIDKRYHIHKWTIVRSDFLANSPIKLLERTLLERSDAQSQKIRNVVCDDVTFILFKLNSWNRRFQLSSRLHSIYFANVLLNHLMTIYDDLKKFYTHSLELNLTSVQLFNFNDLTKFTHMSRLKHLSFYICEFLALEVKPLTKKEKRNIIQCLKGIDSLEIVSTHSLSLSFLESIEKELESELDLNERLFCNVHTISLNHTHGQTAVNDRYNFSTRYDMSKEKKLDSSVLERLFNLHNIKTVKKLKIGCNHIQRLSNFTRDLDDILDEQMSELSESEHCNCMKAFLDDLHLPNVEIFNLVKDGHTVLVNLFSLYYFQSLVCRIMQDRKHFEKLKQLSIDTQSSIYPYYEFYDDPNFQSIVDKFNVKSKDLMRAIKRKQLIETVDFVDYYQSIYVWEIAMKMNECESIMNCNCDQCITVNQKIGSFLKTNKKIQFYLDPTSIKTFNQYYFDLIEVILKILKNDVSNLRGRNSSSGSASRSDDSVSKISSVAQLQVYIESQDEIMSIVNTEFVPWRNQDLSLHSIFRHESYKELVNYNFMRDLSRALTSDDCNVRGSNNPYEIKCNCQGTELKEMAEYVRHQIIRHENYKKRSKETETKEIDHGEGRTTITTNSLHNLL